MKHYFIFFVVLHHGLYLPISQSLVPEGYVMNVEYYYGNCNGFLISDYY